MRRLPLALVSADSAITVREKYRGGTHAPRTYNDRLGHNAARQKAEGWMLITTLPILRPVSTYR
jgi:hypothetical protein